MNVARLASVGVLVSALAVACSSDPSRSHDGGAAGSDVATDAEVGQGGGSGGDDAESGVAGQSGGNGGGGGAGCSPSSDNTMVGCDADGIVTMNYFCPSRSVRIGSCPYGCKVFGSFAGFNPAADCNPAPVDGGSTDADCDGACGDASVDADASATQ